MPTEAPSAGGKRPRLFLLVLLVACALPDLLSPPISPTISRQTQTYAQIQHFVAGGFRPAALTIDIDGPAPFRVVYEFPLYQALTGVLFVCLGPAFLWGKLVSLLAAVLGFRTGLELARRAWGPAIAWRAGLAFAFCPITLLVSTAIQPDVLALAIGSGAAVQLGRWREQPAFGRWLAFLATLLAAALAKFTVLVPFLPLLLAVIFRRDGKWHGLSGREWLAGAMVFVAPFVAWNLYRGTLMDPRYLAGENAAFLVGDLSRFLHLAYYLKPAFILGAMVLCGAGVPLAIAGAVRPGWTLGLLLAGVPLYYLLLPTAAEQTYYAWPLVPALALCIARGALLAENSVRAGWRPAVRAGLAVAWLAGFALAAPYTLRHDDVSLAAARAAAATSAPDDFLLVLNMHDRGVGIGGFNPTIVTLAHRRGWNLALPQPEAEMVRPQIVTRRREGARWLVVTWFTPGLDPWFARFLPASWSRCPSIDGVKVDGQRIANELAATFPVASRGENFLVLSLD